MTIEERKSLLHLSKYLLMNEEVQNEHIESIKTLLKYCNELKADNILMSERILNFSTRHFHDREKIRNSIEKRKLIELMNKYDYFGDLDFETELYKLLEE